MTAVAGLGLLVWAGVLHVAHVAIAGELRPADAFGVAVAVAGAAAVAVALRRGLQGRRRRAWLVAVPLVLAGAQWGLLPIVIAGSALNAPRGGGGLALPGAREVRFRAADGVRLAGTFLPGRSRAAVVLLHGAHDRRADTVAHARLLSRAGFAVLAYDARGHGRSGGRANAFGWRGASDLAGAVAFLRRTPGVDGARIGALGLSMGAETALRAAAAGVPLRAVVADGAGASTVGDQRLTGAGGLELSVLWTGIRLVEALSAEREAAPLRDLAARVRVPALLVASGADGEAAIDRALAARMPRARTWVVPAAAHTRVLQRDPAGYAARVTGFLRSALHTR